MHDPDVDILIDIVKDMYEHSVDPQVVSDAKRALDYYRGLHGIGVGYIDPFAAEIERQKAAKAAAATPATSSVFDKILTTLGVSAVLAASIFQDKTGKTIITGGAPASTNVTVRQDKLPSWVLPTAIGGGIGLILLVVLATRR